MKVKLVILMICFRILSLWVTSQTRTVTGNVTDDKFLSLPGVSILIVGTTTGTVSDADGRLYISNVKSSDRLKISSIGMKEQTIEVGRKSNIAVTLLPDLVGFIISVIR